MALHTEWLRYGENGQYSAYVARQVNAKGPQPAVIVIQEIWGVDEHIQEVADRLALAGYTVAAPDLFASDGSGEAAAAERVKEAKRFLNTVPPSAWRDREARGAELAKYPEDQRKRINETLDVILSAGSRMQAYEAHVAATAGYLRNDCAYSAGQGVASVGFCLGGALSARLAIRDPLLRGAVIFYGSPPDDAADLSAIQAPLLGFYGEQDKRITDAVPGFAAALQAAGKTFDYVVYPGAQHAFFNDTRPTYEPRAARDAYARTLTFLNQVLTS